MQRTPFLCLNEKHNSVAFLHKWSFQLESLHGKAHKRESKIGFSESLSHRAKSGFSFKIFSAESKKKFLTVYGNTALAVLILTNSTLV